MSTKFRECLAFTLEYEGGYVNHPSDPGGATNKGISLRYARTLGSMVDINGDGVVNEEDIKIIPLDKVEMIYRNWFWRDIQGDVLPAGVDLAVFDFAVNSGGPRAVRTLQRIVGAVEDGIMGPATLAAVQAYVKRTEGATFNLVLAICNERLTFLKTLRTWPTFGKGWTRRVRSCEREARELIGRPLLTTREAMATNTGKSTAAMATVGSVVAMASQAQPVIQALGSLAPMVAVAIILVAGACFILWRKNQTHP